MSETFSAELYILDCLARAVDGLPIFFQSLLFDNLRSDIYELAKQHQLGRWPRREEALRRATDDVIGDPVARNLQYRRSYWWEILRERPADARVLLWQILRRPAQRQLYKGLLSRPFGPAAALQSDPELLERLRAKFGNDYVDKISWPGTFAWPLEYLGCMVTESYLVFSVGHEIWEDYGGSRHRHVTYYAFVEGESAPHPVASNGICWTDEEGVVYPVSMEPQSIVDRRSQEAGLLSSYCTNWLETQCEVVKLFTWNHQGKPLTVSVSGHRRQGHFADFWFQLPDLSERQITWAILGTFVLFMCILWWAMATFIPVNTTYAELPSPPPPDMNFDLTPLTKGEAFRMYSIFAAIIGGLLAIVGGIITGIYCAARVTARDLLASTPLGVPKKLRHYIYDMQDT